MSSIPTAGAPQAPQNNQLAPYKKLAWQGVSFASFTTAALTLMDRTPDLIHMVGPTITNTIFNGRLLHAAVVNNPVTTTALVIGGLALTAGIKKVGGKIHKAWKEKFQTSPRLKNELDRLKDDKDSSLKPLVNLDGSKEKAAEKDSLPALETVAIESAALEASKETVAAEPVALQQQAATQPASNRELRPRKSKETLKNLKTPSRKEPEPGKSVLKNSKPVEKAQNAPTRTLRSRKSNGDGNG